MILKVKEKYVNSTIQKGRDTIVLNDDLTQKELLWIHNVLNSEFVEFVEDKPLIVEEDSIETKKTTKKKTYKKKSKINKKEDDKDNEKSE